MDREREDGRARTPTARGTPDRPKKEKGEKDMKNNIKRIFAVRDGSFTRSEEAQRLYRAYLDAERAFY